MNKSRIMLVALLGGFIAAAPIVATGCTGHTYGTVRLVASSPPPPPKYVSVEQRPGYVWVRGHWARYNGGWVWQEGYWVEDRSGYVYVPGQWERRGSRYVWVPSRWMDEEAYHRERKARREHERPSREIDIRRR